MRAIDLNCDMGESLGVWKLGDDEAIMPHITSANVACGAHAGDPQVMAATLRLAARHNVAVGAHPGYPDLLGFGRRPLAMPADEVRNLVLCQVGALWAVGRAYGLELRHVKPHGALYNRACVDLPLADAVAEAVKLFSRSLYLVGLPGSQLEAAAEAHGLSYLREGFVDRVYEPNGLLRDRQRPDALVTEPGIAAAQAVSLAGGKVTCHGGGLLSLQVDTLCVHGDTSGAAEVARAVNSSLRAAGYRLSSPAPG